VDALGVAVADAELAEADPVAVGAGVGPTGV